MQAPSVVNVTFRNRHVADSNWPAWIAANIFLQEGVEL
jgi:hypothetical protein